MFSMSFDSIFKIKPTKTQEEYETLIKEHGKETAFLMLARERNFTFIKKMVETYGKDIVKTYGVLPIDAGFAGQLSLPGNALRIAIIGNPMDHNNRMPEDLVELVKFLIKAGCPIDDERFLTSPLYCALLFNLDPGAMSEANTRIQVASELLNAGANFYAACENGELPGQTFLSKAKMLSEFKNIPEAKKQYYLSITTLLNNLYERYHFDQEKADKISKAIKQKTDFLDAVLESDIATIKQLLDDKCDIDLELKLNSLRVTPLAVAVMTGKEDIALLLIEKGADINKKIHDQETNEECDLSTLSIASPNKKIILSLLKAGANPNAIIRNTLLKNISPDSPLSMLNISYRVWHAFALLGDKEIVQLFLNNVNNLKVDIENQSADITDFLSPKRADIVKLYQKAEVEYTKKLEETGFLNLLNILPTLNQFATKLSSLNPKSASYDEDVKHTKIKLLEELKEDSTQNLAATLMDQSPELFLLSNALVNIANNFYLLLKGEKGPQAEIATLINDKLDLKKDLSDSKTAPSFWNKNSPKTPGAQKYDVDVDITKEDNIKVSYRN